LIDQLFASTIFLIIDNPKPFPLELGFDFEKRSNIFSVFNGNSTPVLEKSIALEVIVTFI